MGKLMLTIKANTLNVRRGPTDGASIIGRAAVGNVFDVVQIIDTPSSKEQWARIEYQGYVEAYICTRMPDGKILGQVNVMPDKDNAEFIRGWNACLDAILQVLVTLRK